MACLGQPSAVSRAVSGASRYSAISHVTLPHATLVVKFFSLLSVLCLNSWVKTLQLAFSVAVSVRLFSLVIAYRRAFWRIDV